MVRSPKLRPSIALIASAALALFALAGCDSPQNTFSPKSDTADSILSIYILVTVVASIVGFAVLVAMVWLMVKYRAKPGVPARQIHGNNRLEVAWTIAPVLVLILIGAPPPRCTSRQSATNGGSSSSTRAWVRTAAT
jgi:cytochrome c oxidase subunit 2